MRFTASEIAAAVGGRLVGPDVTCDGASIDSRSLQPGQLFVPIVAERDGHEFVDAARTAGASAWLTSQAGDEHEVDDPAATMIVVADTADALTALGRVARQRHSGPVIGITGSVGKTSVKDLAAAGIGAELRTHSSERSFNNELGVPLTLINAPDDTEVLVVEMGARGRGHIAELCDIAVPTIGIVTWVGAVHTSEFGSVEAVAEAKGELIEALPVDGVAILNDECEPVRDMRSRATASVVTYGVDAPGAMVSAREVELDGDLRPRFVAQLGDARQAVRLDVRGLHQVSNALAALAAADAVGVSLESAAGAMASASLSPWRMELSRAESGAWILNDAYNANAISTEAALRSLAALDASRHVAVLGVMAELGDRHDADHRLMSELCGELGIELIAYRESAYGITPLETHEAVVGELGPLTKTDAVLVKGSRVAGLERLAERLAGS